MRTSHEAIADQANVEFFHIVFLSYSSHPWASRTETIAPRMEFQVCCFSITSLGNMQPSQQICRNALVSFPSSSRSQCPASRAIFNFPLGSSGRQCFPVLSWEPLPLTVASFWATWKSIVHGRNACVIVFKASWTFSWSFQLKL